jgi:hypothetical protein
VREVVLNRACIVSLVRSGAVKESGKEQRVLYVADAETRVGCTVAEVKLIAGNLSAIVHR